MASRRRRERTSSLELTDAERDGSAAPGGSGSKPESCAVRVTRVPLGVVVAARDAGSGARPASFVAKAAPRHDRIVRCAGDRAVGAR